jgi:hypothetical protein
LADLTKYGYTRYKIRAVDEISSKNWRKKVSAKVLTIRKLDSIINT